MEKYRKIKMIGKGAFGTVYLTSRIRDKKLLILKEINVEDMTKDERSSAIVEVQILKRLHHPNIIKYYENFIDEKNLVIAMEYAQGGTLNYFLGQQTSLLKEEKIASFFIQIVVALQYIHSQNILHRDLNTNNVLLDKKFRVVKLSDFGISKILNTKTKASSVVGTPSYISPELCKSNPYNQKSDVWALGCLLYELMTLRKAFEAQSLPALVMKIVQGDYNKELPTAYNINFKRLVMAMLDLIPEKRPSVSEIMTECFLVKYLIDLYCNIGAVEIKNPKVNPDGKLQPKRSNLHTSPALSIESLTTNQQSSKLLNYSVNFWGAGNAQPILLPLPNSDTRVVQATISRTKKACVTENGRLLIWESSSNTSPPGALGDSHNVTSYIPRFLEGQSAVTIKQVACGDLHTACLTDRGILMTFGSGSNGCLGHGSFQDVDKPMIVEKLLGYELSHISSGSYHMLAVSTDGEVFAWGRGENGRLGLNNNKTYNIPTMVPQLSENYDVESVYCGVDCSMLLTKSKKLLACGSNVHNRLGLDQIHGEVMVEQSTGSSVFTLLKTQPICLKTIHQVSLGMQHSAVVTKEGDLITFGNNSSGQLGTTHNQETKERFPNHVTAIPNVKYENVGCGGTFTVACTRDGKIYSWGKSTRGQLGRTSLSVINPPQLVNVKFNSTHASDQVKVVSLAVNHAGTIAVVSGTSSEDNKFRVSWDTNTWREESKNSISS